MIQGPYHYFLAMLLNVENTLYKTINFTIFLTTGNPEDKVCGCQSLSNLTSSQVIEKIILSKKLVRAVAPLVLEKEDMVQLSALGALR